MADRKTDEHLRPGQVGLLAQLDDVTELQDRVWTGHDHRRWVYRFANRVPLRAGPKTLYVNWCELTIVQEDSDAVLYRNAFATISS